MESVEVLLIPQVSDEVLRRVQNVDRRVKVIAVKSLKETNPHLRDADKYEELLIANVTSSTAIELGSVPRSITRCLRNHRPARRIKSKSRKKSG